MKIYFTCYCRATHYIYVLFLLILSTNCTAQSTETFTTGSYIINMGATNPGTVSNSIKPYGLIYDLLRNYNVPVKMIINSAKAKDGVDFTYNGSQYKGGTFIIKAEYRTAAVNSRITYWIGQGVVGTTTISALTLNVTRTLDKFPRWTLDAQNGKIAEGFLLNAGINNTAFPAAYNWKTPAQLDGCNDFYVMPHADPTWANHGRLWSWNKDQIGAIWAGCHAVSVLENMFNPSIPAQKTNFLSTTGLVLFGSHGNASPPYTHQYPTDPVAQYLGKTDLAMLNGSEQVFLPKLGGAWNPGVKIIAYDPTQADIPVKSPGQAVLIVYGRGMDDPARGYVMYEASHNINNGSNNSPAAQRAFFNFSFCNTVEKNPVLTVTGITEGMTVPSGGTVSGLNVVASSLIPGATFTYQWTSGCGGSFSNPTSATTNFAAPNVAVNTTCTITCKVTDNCGRATFQTYIIIILANNLPTVVNDAQSLDPGCGGVSLTYNVLANDSDQDGQPLTLTNVTGVLNGIMSFNANGNITYSPNAGFFGVETLTYTVCDNTSPAPLCSTGTYTITVGNIANVPNSANDAFTIAEDIIGRFNVLANDIPVVSGPLTVSAITANPANGKVSINTDNTITYVPNPDFSGINTFTYRLVNSLGYSKTATVTVNVINDACNGGTYQNGYLGGGGTLLLYPAADNYLNEGSTTRNYGSCTSILVDGQNNSRLRTLLKFDLSAIPAGATITGASLQMVATLVQSNTAFAIDVHNVTTAWAEGSVCNANGTPNWTATNPWTIAGGDFDATVQATTNVSTIGTYTWTLNNSLVQGWYNTPATNMGMLLKFNTEGGANQPKTFSSREGTSTPVLSITYTTTNGLGTANGTNTGDNELYEPNPTTNYGACNFIEVGGRTSSNNKDRSIVRFSFAGIPVGSVINSATLSMKIAAITTTTQAIDIFRMTRASAEGAGICGGTNNVVANWTNAATGIPWTTPGGDFTGNTGATPYATTTVNTGTAVGTTINWNIASLIQEWNDGTYSNFGLLLKGPETVNGLIDFWSKEHTTVADRPTVSINYTAPPVCFANPARAPMAMPDTANTPNSIAINIATAVNDYFPVAGAKTYSIITAPVSGIAAINASTGVINYTPNTTYNGLRSMVYRVLDNTSGLADTALVYVNITNGPIVANDDYPSSALSAVQQTINVKANDTDPENAVLGNIYTVNIVTGPLRGTAAVDGNGNIVYMPNNGFSGNDTLFYSISEPAPACGSPFRDTAMVVIVVINRPPTPVDDTRDGPPCQAITVNLLANDTDPEENILTVTNISALNPPAAGVLTNNNDGTVTFMPAVGFTGTVTFTYTVTDNGIPPLTSAPVTVTINIINPVPNTAPVAVNDVDTTNMDQILYENVLDNDYDPDNNPLTQPVITIAPLHGTATVNPVNGLIQYTPNPGYFGTDVLTYQICDILTLNVATCAPGPGACVSATLTITIPIPNGTYAVNDENSTWINTAVSGVTLINDFDLEADGILFTGFVNNTGVATTSGSITVSGLDDNGSPVADAGTLTILAFGGYTYTPASGFTGTMTVPYTITDNNANPAFDTGWLSITVNPLRAAGNSVIANNDENITYGAAVNGNVKENDRDPQTHPFSVTAFTYDSDGDGVEDLNGTVGNPVSIGGLTTTGRGVTNAGTLVINSTGTYSYTPATDFHGTVRISYTICDNAIPVGACAAAGLYIDVLTNGNGAANDMPFGGDDFGYTSVNVPVNGNYANNDYEPNSNPMSMAGITINTGGPHTLIQTLATTRGGTVEFYTDGSYTYNPPVNYTGPDLVTYSLCDVTAIAPQPLCAGVSLHLLVTMGSVLPVDLLTFTGKRAGKDNFLQWSTAQEINSDHFELENWTDNTAVSKIATIAAKGYSSIQSNYSYIHRSPAGTVNYYRLKIVDKDNRWVYSNVVAMKNDGTAAGLNSVYPNPFRNKIDLIITTEKAEKLSIRIIDINGKNVRVVEVNAIKGLNQFSISNLDNIAAATYFIEVQGEYTLFRAKIFKTN